MALSALKARSYRSSLTSNTCETVTIVKESRKRSTDESSNTPQNLSLILKKIKRVNSSTISSGEDDQAPHHISVININESDRDILSKLRRMDYATFSRLTHENMSNLFSQLFSVLTSKLDSNDSVDSQLIGGIVFALNRLLCHLVINMQSPSPFNSSFLVSLLSVTRSLLIVHTSSVSSDVISTFLDFLSTVGRFCHSKKIQSNNYLHILRALLMYSGENHQDLHVLKICESLSEFVQLFILRKDESSNAKLLISRVLAHLQVFTADYDEIRVRRAALRAIYKIFSQFPSCASSFAPTPADFYDWVCSVGVDDEDDALRLTCFLIISIVGKKYGDHFTSCSFGGIVRLVDVVFSTLSNAAANDSNMNVRRFAFMLLKNFDPHIVSPPFLDQTLDKKMLDGIKEYYNNFNQNHTFKKGGRGGEGRDGDNQRILSLSTCGAFVHGLEDQLMSVRISALHTLSTLASELPSLGVRALEFIVDMFNDEIEDVRILAIEALQQISPRSNQQSSLRSKLNLQLNHLEIILSGLEDFSIVMREQLRFLLQNVKLSTNQCLRYVIDKLLDNLKRYPQDQRSIFNTFKWLGGNHPQLTFSIIPNLLQTHPFFEMPEPDVDDTAYVCVMLMIGNARSSLPNIDSLLGRYSLSHLEYLTYRYPMMLPESNSRDVVMRTSSESAHQSSLNNFLMKILISGEINEDSNMDTRILILKQILKSLTRFSQSMWTSEDDANNTSSIERLILKVKTEYLALFFQFHLYAYRYISLVTRDKTTHSKTLLKTLMRKVKKSYLMLKYMFICNGMTGFPTESDHRLEPPLNISEPTLQNTVLQLNNYLSILTLYDSVSNFNSPASSQDIQSSTSSSPDEITSILHNVETLSKLVYTSSAQDGSSIHEITTPFASRAFNIFEAFIKPDIDTQDSIEQLSNLLSLRDCPLTVVRLIPHISQSLQLGSHHLSSLRRGYFRCSAVMNEPRVNRFTQSVPLVYTAGMILAIKVDADISHLHPHLAHCLRVCVGFSQGGGSNEGGSSHSMSPSSCQMVCPKRSELILLSNKTNTTDEVVDDVSSNPCTSGGSGSSGSATCYNYRLVTQALLSNQLTSEPVAVQISVVLDVSGLENFTTTSNDDGSMISLCSPVSVSVWPKAASRNNL